MYICIIMNTNNLYEKLISNISISIKNTLNEMVSEDDAGGQEVRDFLKEHPEIDTPMKLKNASSRLYFKAYDRKMLYLLPNRRKMKTTYIRKGSLKDAKQMALKDINADSNSINRKLMVNDSIDKDINKLWFPEADNNLKNFFIDYYDFSTKRWDIALTEWDWIHSRELSNLLYNIMKDKEEEDELYDLLISEEFIQKLYRKFLVFNKPINKDVWNIYKFLKIWLMKIAKINMEN